MHGVTAEIAAGHWVCRRSTFDAIHTSWTYHSGYSHTALFEFYRVVRPGGYLIFSTWDKVADRSRQGSSMVMEFARIMNWRLVTRFGEGSPLGYNNLSYTTFLVYQTPAYSYF